MNKHFNFLILFSLVLFTTSCDSSSEKTESSKESSAVSSKLVEIKAQKKEFLLEDLNDPEFYIHERLQFVWKPKGEKTVSVWTMNLDGTDLRRVIEPEKMLYDDVEHLNSTIKRSPNRRYLAYANFSLTLGKSDKNIIDLKTKEIIKLGSDSSGSVFFWSYDGKQLFFLKRFKFHSYNIETKKITTLSKRFYAQGLTALLDGKTIIGYTGKGVAYYDYDGKYLNSVNLKRVKEQVGNIKSITTTGSHILHINSSKYWLHELINTPTLVKSANIPSPINSSIFVMHDDSNSVYMPLRWGIVRFDLKNNNFYKVYDGNGSRIGNFSILY